MRRRSGRLCVGMTTETSGPAALACGELASPGGLIDVKDGSDSCIPTPSEKRKIDFHATVRIRRSGGGSPSGHNGVRHRASRASDER
jgi:hypothetical protein